MENAKTTDAAKQAAAARDAKTAEKFNTFYRRYTLTLTAGFILFLIYIAFFEK